MPDDGVADFVDIAADLPLWTLADVLGVPESDRYLLFDRANRVIGYQDPEYSTSDLASTVEVITPMARAALAVRPNRDADGRMPDPRTRAGIPDLYAYAHELAAHKRRHPGDDVMSILLQQVDDDGGRVSLEEFEKLFWLFAVAGNETLRNGIPGGMAAPGHPLPPYGHRRDQPGRRRHQGRRQGRRLLRQRQPRPARRWRSAGSGLWVISAKHRGNPAVSEPQPRTPVRQFGEGKLCLTSPLGTKTPGQ